MKALYEISKTYYHSGKRPSLYYWRDHRGLEVDGLIEVGESLYPLEIKSSSTLASDFTTQLCRWLKTADISNKNAALFFGGDRESYLDKIQVWPWNQVEKYFKVLTEGLNQTQIKKQ